MPHHQVNLDRYAYSVLTRIKEVHKLKSMSEAIKMMEKGCPLSEKEIITKAFRDLKETIISIRPIENKDRLQTFFELMRVLFLNNYEDAEQLIKLNLRLEGRPQIKEMKKEMKAIKGA